ncbi:MAG: signal recognition particle-docking protein FtsY [Mollicutes bacterium PWAP]|nr:signal recognition particle-docking protein FtsY [Mollicutes bacterium PWAP]
MGFWNKLKDKIFNINIEKKDKLKSEAKAEKENKVFSKKLKKTITKKTDKITIKTDKKISKEKTKRRIKENKINKYVAGLDKSGSSFSERIKVIQSRHNTIDDDFFEDLEDVLIMSDISMNLVEDIVDSIKVEVKKENVTDPKLIGEIISEMLFNLYANRNIVDTTINYKENRLNIFMMVGVNGAGKTTSIAKISNNYKKEGKKVLIAAGDTFRAGAVEQLEVWSERVGVDIVKPSIEGADPSSVVFDAVKKAKNEKYDLLIIDTAGRLQNKVNLMNELAKMSKIIKREVPDGPHEVFLVLDSTTGQNGVSQAEKFKEVTPITGIVLTKMDGTSKGGIVFNIKDKLDLDVKLIGLGETIEDLQEFDLEIFIYGFTKGLNG